MRVAAREKILSISLSLSRFLPSPSAHAARGLRSSYRFMGEERDPRPDNEIGEATSEALRNLDALNTPDDRAPPTFPIQTPTGYFRTDVRRAKCARVGFNYGRVLGQTENGGINFDPRIC